MCSSAAFDSGGVPTQKVILVLPWRNDLSAFVVSLQSISCVAHIMRFVHLVAHVQEENAEARQSLEVLDKQVSKVTNALAMEQALTSACMIKKNTVEERMGSLIDQVETMHAKWKEEQDARMQRQQEVYQHADELRGIRVQLIEANASNRYDAWGIDAADLIVWPCQRCTQLARESLRRPRVLNSFPYFLVSFM